MSFWIVHEYVGLGPCPTNDISIKFKIIPKFEVLWFKPYSTDHNENLHTSRQCNCRDMCKILLWSVEQILNYSPPNFDQISNSIQIALVGWGPGTHFTNGLWAHGWNLWQFCAICLILMIQWSNNFAHAMSSNHCQISIKPEVWWYIMFVNSYNDDSGQNEWRSRVVLIEFIWKQSAYPGIGFIVSDNIAPEIC